MNATYECDGCGACCRSKLVDLYEVDLLRETRLCGHMMPLREPGLDGEIGYLNCLTGGSCPFLDGENCCGIYMTRPSACVVFPAGGQDCQDARRSLGLASLEPKGDGSTSVV